MSTYVSKKRTQTLSRALPSLDVLASRPIVRILRYLATHGGAHTGRQLAAGVAVARAMEALSKLVDMGVLHRQRAGRAFLFSLNETNYLVSDVLLPAFRGEARWLEALGSEVLTALDGLANSVILYGSWARGQATSTSDVDLVVVTQGEHRTGQAERVLEDQRGRLAERFGRSVSLLVIDQNQFRQRLRRHERLIREIVREGRAVAGQSLAEVVGGG